MDFPFGLMPNKRHEHKTKENKKRRRKEKKKIARESNLINVYRLIRSLFDVVVVGVVRSLSVFFPSSSSSSLG
jgi:hypothetical protein